MPRRPYEPRFRRRFGVFATSFQAQGHYANAYREVEAHAILVRPGGTEARLPLFYDGGSTWRLRVNPDQTGAWRYRVVSPDPGLAGAAGAFICTTSGLRGGIEPMPDHPYHTYYPRNRINTSWLVLPHCGQVGVPLIMTHHRLLHHSPWSMWVRGAGGGV